MTISFDPDRLGVSLHDAAIVYRCSPWRRSETAVLEAFQRRLDGEALNRAAAMFKVARQFPGSSGDKEARSALFDSLTAPVGEAVNGLTDANLVQRVTTLTEEMRKSGRVTVKDGKPITPLSACSKFVWCAVPDRGVIYDERARAALSALGYEVAARDYRAFVDAFRRELDRQGEELNEVMELLGPLARRPWQRAKLLDFWLYSNAGSAGR